MDTITSKKLGPWNLNSVYCEDSLAAIREIPDSCIDVAVTSPPYWGQRGDIGLGSEQDPRVYINNLTSILLEVIRVLKPSGIFWLNIGDAYNTPINWRFEDYKYSSLGHDKNGLDKSNSAYTKNRGRRRAFIDKSAGWLKYGNLLAIPYRIVIALCDKGAYFRGETIWVKSKPMPEGRCRRPHRKHESLYILTKSDKHKFSVSPPVSSVWDIKPDMNTTKHTSTFPVDLPYKCIQASGIDTGIVLDPFMGSGTTGIAARLLGFDYLGFDINSENVKIANERIKSFLRENLVLFENS